VKTLLLLLLLCATAQAQLQSMWLNRPAVVSATNIQPDLLWWKLTEGSGTTLNDSSGGGTNTGTIHNSPSWVATGSQYALSFTAASTQYVLNANTVNYSHITIACWLKMPSVPSSPTAIFGFCQGNAGTAYDKDFYVTNATGYPVFYANNGGSISTSGGASVCDGNWHFLVGTADGSHINLYVDGVFASQFAATTTYTGYSAANLLSAGEYHTSYVYGTFSLYDLRIYSYALTAGQVSNLFRYNAPR
jgi:hypothetical protein